MKNNPELAQKLPDPNLSLDEKQLYQNQFKAALEAKLGYKIANDVKSISTSQTGQDDQQVAGFISTENGTIYSNDINQLSTEDTIYTMGQEFAGGIQNAQGTDITTNRVQHNQYQDSIAQDTVDDINFIMGTYHDSALAITNNHQAPTSLEAYLQLQKNNEEFAKLDKEQGDNNPLLVIPIVVVALETFSNAPETEEDIQTGPTNSINLLPGTFVLKNVVKVYQGAKTVGTTVIKYDPSLTITGATVATGTSAYTNYDKYDGMEYVTHVGIDGTVSFLVGKYMPAGNTLLGNVGYGAAGGSVSGFSSELSHQVANTYMFDKQSSIDKSEILLNTFIEGGAGAQGKFYKNMGEIMEFKPVVNYGMDIGISQSFKPALESNMQPLQTNQENE